MTFDSVYQIFTPLQTVRKQRFWDWFDGDSLGSRWTRNDVTSTGSNAMADSVDNGVLLSTGAATGAESILAFNNIRHYEETGCVCIGISRTNQNDNEFLHIGLGDSQADSDHTTSMRSGNASSFFTLLTRDTSNNETNTSITGDTNYHSTRNELTSSANTLRMDGVLEVTNTTNLPANALQPWFRFKIQDGTTARTMNVRYFEAYNT